MKDIKVLFKILIYPVGFFLFLWLWHEIDYDSYAQWILNGVSAFSILSR